MKTAIILVATLQAVIGLASAQSISKTGCNTDKGCLFKPDGCDPDKACAFALTYRPTDHGTISFELSAILDSGPAQYVAVGFSNDQQMGKDAVTYCVHKSDSSQQDHVGLSYNNGRNNEPVRKATDLESEMLTNQRFWSESRDGKTLFVCRFEQKLKSQSNAQRVYDLSSQSYFLLLATGSADPQTNQLSKHTSALLANPTTISLTSIQAQPQGPPPVSAGSPQGPPVASGAPAQPPSVTPSPEPKPKDNKTKLSNATAPEAQPNKTDNSGNVAASNFVSSAIISLLTACMAIVIFA